MANAQYLSYEVDSKFKVDGASLTDYYNSLGATNTTSDSKTKVQEWHAAFYVKRFSMPIGGYTEDIENRQATDVETNILCTHLPR